MKIRITASSVMCGGNIHARGDILTDKEYSEAYLNHLLYEASAGELLEYETKVEPPAPEKGAVIAPKKRKYTRRKKPSPS